MKARQRAMDLGMPPGALFAVIDIAQQSMQVMSPSCAMLARYPVSTSRRGAGEVVDSFCTPRGFHEVVERYGDGLALGSVFTSRKFSGEVMPESAWRAGEGDRILTRILRLAGREPGTNAGGNLDSYDRMIYIHGTNQEQFIGVAPSSHGCVRMNNRDVAALFDLVKDQPLWVLIQEGS